MQIKNKLRTDVEKYLSFREYLSGGKVIGVQSIKLGAQKSQFFRQQMLFLMLCSAMGVWGV